MDQRQHILRILKEAMHNALKHAHCRNIRLTIHTRERTVVFKLEDDGRGFEVDTLKSQGTGLTNMKNRSAALKGQLRIESGPDKGTRIELSIKLPQQVVV
jgi:signal transduction histidine kinase